MDTFCVRPFVHSLIDTKGEYRPCCRYSGSTGHNIKTHTLEQWWSSDYLADLRQRMLTNQKVPECWRCYRQEQQGAESFRQSSNREWITKSQVNDYPEDWEIQITNLCNLKCLMCNAWSSSQVLLENNMIFGTVDDQRDYEWNAAQIDEIRKMFATGKSFVIRGGEPFIVPWLRHMVGEIKERKSFLINTNATKFDEQWFDILSRHDVKISLSIDGFDSLNHYIRYPSDWQTIVRHIDIMRQLPGVNIFINTCVQNLNVLALDRLLSWAFDQNLFVNLDVLTYPRYLEPACLPESLRSLALQRLSNLPDHVIANCRGIDGVHACLQTKDLSEWDGFVQYITRKDQHRHNHIVDYIPEMSGYF